MSDRSRLRAGSRLARHASARVSASPSRSWCWSCCRSSPRRFCSISPTRCCSPSIGALALMLLTGFAGLISLGTAGLLGAGAYTVGMLVREIAAPFWVTLPAAALLGAFLGLIFGLPSLRLRGLYLAISTLGLHFIVVYLGGEYEARRGAVDRRHDRFAVDRRLFADQRDRAGISCCSAFAALALLISVNLQRSRTGRAWRALARARRRRRRARHRRAALQAHGLHGQLDHDGDRRRAVCLLPQFRLDRRFLALSDRAVCRHDHHRRHGLDRRRAARRGFVILFPYAIEAVAGSLARPLQQHGVRARLRGLRRRHDPVPAARARRADRHLAPDQKRGRGSPRAGPAS